MAEADIIRARLELHAEMAQALIDPQLEATVAAVAHAICESYRRGGKMLLFGNGGSAADAEHIAGELTGRYLMARCPRSRWPTARRGFRRSATTTGSVRCSPARCGRSGAPATSRSGCPPAAGRRTCSPACVRR